MDENPTIHPSYTVEVWEGSNEGGGRSGWINSLKVTFLPDRPAAQGYQGAADSDGNDLYSFLYFSGDWLGIELEATDLNAAKFAIAAILSDMFHECIEFTYVHGQRIAAPHPKSAEKDEDGDYKHSRDAEAWRYLMDSFLQVVDGYLEGFPIDEDAPGEKIPESA